MSKQQIPVIDAGRLNEPTTLYALDTACREWGAFYVVNHGLGQHAVDRVLTESRRFFAQPIAMKRAITRTAENPWGFYDRELTKNTLDWKQIFDYGPDDRDSKRAQWPAGQPGFKSAVLEHYAACERLAFSLLRAMAANLGVPADFLTSSFEPVHTSFMRLNYYPPCPDPERPEGLATPSTGHLGLNHHTDAGALTLLLQDEQPGLEVLHGGKWRLVEPRRDSLVVNVGDIVQVWSNDRYEAAVHRVVANADAERYSVPFFFSPAYAADYAPLPTMAGTVARPRYRSINWGEFYRLRAAGDYADYGDEVQISHYRV